MAIWVALVFIAIAAFVVLVVWLSLRAAKKHRLAMEGVAAQMGWTLRRRDPKLIDHLHDIEPFNFGSNRAADWIFEGEVGAKFSAFQYECKTHSNSNKGHTETQVHYYRVCIVEMPLVGHGLRIRRETIGHKIMDAFGGEDIDFESDDFSRKFWVKCDNRRFAYDVIHPDMMDYLDPHSNWFWHWHGKQLILYQSGSLRPQQVKEMVQIALGFHARLPRHLTH